MTCIVGLVYKDIVYIGGDSASISGGDIDITELQKVFRKGDFLIGYTTSFRMGQILQYHLKIPEKKKGGSDEEYMVVVFVEAVRKCFNSFGFATIKDNEESGGSFLVGFNKNLFYIGSDYQVNLSQNKYDAIGAGREYALGSFFSSDKYGSFERVEIALQAAAHHSAAVLAPFNIINSLG